MTISYPVVHDEAAIVDVSAELRSEHCLILSNLLLVLGSSEKPAADEPDEADEQMNRG